MVCKVLWRCIQLHVLPRRLLSDPIMCHKALSGQDGGIGRGFGGFKYQGQVTSALEHHANMFCIYGRALFAANSPKERGIRPRVYP